MVASLWLRCRARTECWNTIVNATSEQDRDHRSDRGNRFRLGRGGAVARVGLRERGIQPRLDAAGLVALAQLQRRLRRMVGGHERRELVDEPEVLLAHRRNPGGGAAVVEPRERGERGIEDALLLRQPQVRLELVGHVGLRDGRRVERRLQEHSALISELLDHDLRVPRLVHPSLEADDRAERDQAEHPHAHQQQGRAPESTPTPVAAAATGGGRLRYRLAR